MRQQLNEVSNLGAVGGVATSGGSVGLFSKHLILEPPKTFKRLLSPKDLRGRVCGMQPYRRAAVQRRNSKPCVSDRPPQRMQYKPKWLRHLVRA